MSDVKPPFMSILSRIGKALIRLAEDFEQGGARKRFLREYREQQDAKIARGEAPPRFRSYKEYLQSSWWERLRAHVLNYLSHRCEFCAARATQVHHVRYPRTTDLGSESIKSLYAVCKRCHEIAHGKYSGSPFTSCAFCGASGTRILTIALKNHEQSMQRVCCRCDSLAKGYRGQANNWAKDYYEDWVSRWRQTMPPLEGTRSPNPFDSKMTNEVKAIAVPAMGRSKEEARLVVARQRILQQREREFEALSTKELRRLWDNRAQSDYEDDELKVLLSVNRRRLGYVH